VKALLRFQGMVLLRANSNPFVLLLLILPATFAWSAMQSHGGFGGLISAGAAFLFIAAFGIADMATTFVALDAVRWTSPLRPQRVLAAHVLFWLLVFVVPLAVVAAIHADDVPSALVLFAHLSFVVAGAAALIPVFRRLRRHRAGWTAAVGGGLVGLVLAWPAAWSVFLAWTGNGGIGIATIFVVFCIALAIGVPSFLREELLPAAAGAVVEPRYTRDDVAERVAARSPLATLLRTAYSPVWTCFWTAFGGVFPLVFPSMNIVAIWTALAASNLAGLALQSWRWLVATPIDRVRAFRILFGPLLAFVLVVTATRLAVVEVASDRSAFFRDYRYDGFITRGPATLSLYELLEHESDSRAYLTPDASRIATHLQEHFRETYGLSVARDRIEADILRGWPEHPSTGIMDADQTAVLDAMERVRVDLADDIAGATRRRDLVIAAGLVLAFLVMLRAQFAGRLLGVFLVILVGLPLATLALFRRDVPSFAAAADKLYAAMTGASPTALWLAFAAACALGVFLWRSASKAFRRIDLLDLPPNPPAWMRS